MIEFLQRLKQRKLVQWSVAYVAAAFALLRETAVVAQQFGWPDGVRRGITLVLLVGFFVTLVLALDHGERGSSTGLSDAYLNVLGQPDAWSRKARQSPAFQGFAKRHWTGRLPEAPSLARRLPA